MTFGTSTSEGAVVIGLQGFIDKTGATVIEPGFSHADDFHDGLAFVREDGGCGFVDRTGRTLIDQFHYESSSPDTGVACNARAVAEARSVHVDAETLKYVRSSSAGLKITFSDRGHAKPLFSLDGLNAEYRSSATGKRYTLFLPRGSKSPAMAHLKAGNGSQAATVWIRNVDELLRATGIDSAEWKGKETR